MQPFVKKITKIELFGLNERVIEEDRKKLKKTKEDKHEDEFEQWLLQVNSLLLYSH